MPKSSQKNGTEMSLKGKLYICNSLNLFEPFRQIMGTKENLLKWADVQYKGSNQSYEKITRKPRTCLSKSEREDIAAFISQNR